MGLETQSKHEPPINVGTEILRSDGYCVIGDVAVTPDHYDAQGHLNNAAIGRLFNDMRISYILETVGMWWVDILRTQKLVVAARESHILYESEGLPGETYVGAMRYLRLEGKGAVLEQRLVESTTGRAVARAWVVQLLLQHGSVIEWPPEYFDRLGAIEGRMVEVRSKSDRRWGPDE